MNKTFTFLYLLFGIITAAAGPLQAQTAALRGQITDAETGAPLADANVTLSSPGEDVRKGTATDSAGHYAFAGLPPGRYVLRVSAVGFQTAARTVVLQPDESQALNLPLQPSTYTLNEIVVRGTDRTENSPTTVQRIPAEELEAQDLSTVADVARLLPAAHVATNSRGQTILYLRNSSDRQTAQFFNGALINVPWDNRVDLSFLPSAMLGSVTVSKGVPSVVYGTNTIGGAVNFRARSLAEAGSLTELTLTGSSPGLGGASLLQTGKHGSFSYTAETAYSRRDDFRLPEGADLPYSQPSDETRVNTDHEHFNLFFEGRRQYDNGARLGATLFHVEAEKGVAPESNLNPEETGVRFWRYPMIRQSMGIVSGMLPIGDGSRLRGSVWLNRFAQDIHQFQSVEYEQLDRTQADLDLTAGLRAIFEQQLGSGEIDIALNALTTRHRQTIVPYRSGSAESDSTGSYGQQIYSLGAEYAVPLGPKLTAMVGASYDGSAITDTGPWEERGYDHYLSSAVGLSAGLTYRFSDRLLLRSVVGRKPRFPTMRELYAGALGKFVPNPGLKPVTARLGEAALEWYGTALSGSLTAFISRLYDTIDQTTIQQGPNAGKEQRINLDGSRVWGIEATTTARPLPGLALNGSLTYMNIRAYLDGETRKLDEKPTWLGRLNANYTVTERLGAMLQAEYTGGIYTRTEQNTFVSLPNAFILDTRLSYQLFGTDEERKGGQIFFRVNNITNDMRILQLGLPGPGREYMAGLKLRF